MTQTLTLPVTPSQASYSETYAPRVRKVSFGDGYEQRAVDGMHGLLMQASFAVEHLDETDKGTLLSFFETRGGWESFYYTLPLEASPRLWVCEQWSVNATSGNRYTVSFGLREVADYV